MFEVGDHVSCNLFASKGIIWVIEEINEALGTGRTATLAPVFVLFGNASVVGKKFNIQTRALTRINIMDMAKEYARFGEFIRALSDEQGMKNPTED